MPSLPGAVRTRDRDGGQIRIPVTAAAAVDPTDGDLARTAAKPKWSPEMRLCAAILGQAVLDVRRYPADSRRYREAHAWLWNDAESGVHAFPAICAQLGLDPVWIRARVVGPIPVRRWLHAARH